MDIYERSLALHREHKGKIEIRSRMRLETTDDLSLAYTPGVARPCEAIAADPSAAWDLTWRGRTVAVVTDGSAVLGLGDIGAAASLPVMEGKAALFSRFAGVDAIPIALDVHEPDDFVAAVRALAPTFGGINLEDISAPRCFEIEERLQDIGIPVLHDDQHGTAIVLLAGLLNAAKVVGRPMDSLSVVINGAGAAGRAIAFLLSHESEAPYSAPVKQIRICDSRGMIYPGRPGNGAIKEEIGRVTNPEAEEGDIHSAIRGADVFIGVSKANLLSADDIRQMAPDSIVFPMANPVPEIMPDEAFAGGAAVVGTGRSDFPNQVNNVLAFPGLFRGALQARATRFTPAMKRAAVDAIAGAVARPTPEEILPSPFDLSVPPAVAAAVEAAWKAEKA